MLFAQRTAQLRSAIFSQLEYEKQKLMTQGQEVINFSIGTPDLPPPAHVMTVLKEAAGQPRNYRYAITDSPELILAVQSWYERRFGVALDPDEVMSLMGSQDGLAHIGMAIVDPGDIVLVPDPGYPIFSVGPHLAGAKIYPVPLLPENRYIMDLEAIEPEIARQAKMIIVSYPNNPVTAIAPPEFYEELVRFAQRYEIVVVHDNAYSELVFDGRKCGSFLSYPGAREVGIEFNSLSKSYNMAGCRISFAVGNKEILNQLRNLKSHLDYGVFLPVQKAAIAALNGPQDCLRDTALNYQQRRDLLLDGLDKLGWKITKPMATMFVWAPVPNRFQNAVEFTFELMRRTGVLVVPGSSFGSKGEGFVRFALVQSEKKIQDAIRNIGYSGIIAS